MNITQQFKDRVKDELNRLGEQFKGNNYDFEAQWGLPTNKITLIRAGSKIDDLVTDAQWMELGRKLNISIKQRAWNVARTEVFTQIEEDITFCKENAKAMVFVDDCEIGKTFTAKYLSNTMPNCFYVDCSESKTRRPFIIALAKAIGVGSSGATSIVKDNIKYCLNNIENPIVIIDEAGDLEYTAFLELKELWNATDGECGWYMMGADGLKAKIDRGIANQKVGFREIFSRYSGKFMKVVPTEKHKRREFYKQLITQVISANCKDKSKVAELVTKCIKNDSEDNIGGLRRAESLLILSNKEN